MKRFPDLPPIWAGGAILASALLTAVVPLWTMPVPNALGYALIIAGFAAMLWTVVYFRRASTTIHPGGTPSALIVEGPFRLNRNPIYTGMTLIVFGAALVFGGLSGLVPALAFPLLITRRFILAEEAALKKVFPAEAGSYFERTRRW
jgi:protein-S-isoprenylcysteine O-methyltransferase Ste14